MKFILAIEIFAYICYNIVINYIFARSHIRVREENKIAKNKIVKNKIEKNKIAKNKIVKNKIAKSHGVNYVRIHC